MKVINLFGGPGCGKSTTAAELFAVMKKAGYKVELVTEYAKDLTYEKNFEKLKDQLFLLGEQHNRIWKLRNDVDYVVTDSPFVIGVTYLPEDSPIDKGNFTKLAVDLYNSYDNLNIVLRRGDIAYQDYGRGGDIPFAIGKDRETKRLLERHSIPFTSVCTKDAVQEIMDRLYSEL